MRPLLASTLTLCACAGTSMMPPGGEGGGAGGGGVVITPPVENCLGKNILMDLGKNRLMVGMMTDADNVAGQAPWDVRYLYLSAGIPDGAGPCQSCTSSCSAGSSCVNGGCAWWGCWQYDQLPPGAYVRDFVTDAKMRSQIPMITYYEEFQASGVGEGAEQVVKMKDAAFMSRYFADWRFTLQQVGQDKALFHIEPDLWGYGMQANKDPHQVQAAVASANATDCAGLENSFAGFGRCMLAMARKYAPNAKVGFHASSWMTNIDVTSNTDPNFDVVAEAIKGADFLKECGAVDTDFVVVETSDRDAGYYQSQGANDAFWDVTNATLPNFAQAFKWAKAVSERIGRPLVWWQLPVGNMSLPNTPNKWKDNRVEYFFGHTGEVAATHAVLMAFGAGAPDQTDPSTDNGNLIAKTKDYVMAGGQQLSCP